MTRSKKKFIILAVIATTMIAVQLVNFMLEGRLAIKWGIWPRHISGLYGIAFAPWLHADWQHLWSNLPPLILLSWFTLDQSIRYFMMVSLATILGGGLLVWIFASNAIHVGASGWIFGLWACLIARSIFNFSLSNLIIAILVILFYGGIAWGLLPKEGISVEGHISGGLCGLLTAWFTRKSKK